MAVVSGKLSTVTNAASRVTEVWVRAQDIRTHDGGLITAENEPVDIATDGTISMTLQEGPAVLGLVYDDGDLPISLIYLLVNAEAQQDLADAWRLAQLTTGPDASMLGRLAQQVIDGLAVIETALPEIRDARDQALEAIGEDADRSAAGATTATEKAAEAAGSATRAEEAEAGAVEAEEGAVAGQELSEDAAAVAVAAAVGAAEASSDKADTSYVDAQDQALGQRIDQEKWDRGPLAPGTDLDTIRASGRYLGVNAGDAKTIVNAPAGITDGRPFVLDVIFAPYGSSNFRMNQEIQSLPYISGEPVRKWSRNMNPAGTVTGWRESIDLHHYSGTGFPEGKVSAPTGATYTDTAATAGAVRWIKTTGTGSTGWQVEYGDTGWRKIDGPGGEYLQEGEYLVRREGRRLWVVLNEVVFKSRDINVSLGWLPLLFRGTHFSVRFPAFVGLEATPSLSVNISTLGYVNIYGTKTDTPTTGHLCIVTDEAWPSTLPGTPA